MWIVSRVKAAIGIPCAFFSSDSSLATVSLFDLAVDLSKAQFVYPRNWSTQISANVAKLGEVLVVFDSRGVVQIRGFGGWKLSNEPCVLQDLSHSLEMFNCVLDALDKDSWGCDRWRLRWLFLDNLVMSEGFV